MTDPGHMDEGALVRLLRMEGEDHGPIRAQVAVGIGPEGPVVLFRAGLLVVAMAPSTARGIARELVEEAARVEQVQAMGDHQA